MTAQDMLINLIEVNIVNQNFSLVWIVKVHDHLGKSRLSRTRNSHKGYLATSFNDQINIRQNISSIAILVADISQLNVALGHAQITDRFFIHEFRVNQINLVQAVIGHLGCLEFGL